MSSEEENVNDPYGAIKFGEFRKYMQNKQSKLKKQQKELGNQASQELVQIFDKLSIYINGYTDPPASDLRRMILQHGGDYQHYIKKLSVTHIIATNLTNSKLQEFRSYKVVKPNWITESIEAKQLLPWQNYRLVPRATTQKELLFNNQQPNTATTGESLNANILANDWARQVSTVNPTFIKRYYETSRLHYLSTWKGELKEIVEKLEQKYNKSTEVVGKKRKRSNSSPRVVMHIDFDCFFASVGIRDRPHLKDKPVAVSHSKGASEGSSSDIASSNYVARSYGIRNGMTIGSAKSMCPDLQVIPYEFEKYRSISETFYEIVFQYADEMQAVSVDEALLEVGSHVTMPNSGQEELLAMKIRNEIREATGCEASIGMGSNILLARMSTKKAKPAGQYYCKTKEDVESLLSNQSVMNLPGVGYAIREKLHDMNIKTVGDVKKLRLHDLQSKLGTKMGQTLYNFSRGIDDRDLTTNQQRQSVSAEVNWGVRFENDENEKTFVEGLSKEVSDRLSKLGVKGKTITVKILKRKEDAVEASKNLGHGIVDSFSKSYTLSNFTDDSQIINKQVYMMLRSFHFSCADIRGLGIQITRLDNNQESISPDQGKLKFKARVVQELPADNKAEEPIAVPKVEGESSVQHVRRKEEMVVDLNVYRELPESVQQELMANYDLKFNSGKDKGKGKEMVRSDDTKEEEALAAVTSSIEKSASIPELPPWSQLDPAALLALPNDMREQVLQQYGNSKPKTIVRSPPRIPMNKISRKTPTSGSRAHNITITQLFQQAGSLSSHNNTRSPTRSHNSTTTNNTRYSSPLQVEGLPYDISLWKELPPDVRTELLAEHRSKQKKLKEKAEEEQNEQLQRDIQTRSLNEDDLNEINTQLTEKIKEPSIQGLIDINDIRNLLREWVTSFKDKPEVEDVQTISDFLVELVKFSDLEKTQLLVIYLNYLIQDYPESSEWRSHTVTMQERISDVVISLYGYPLKF